LDEAGKAEYDSAVLKEQELADKFDAADRLAAGFSTMTNEAKTVFDSESLKWQKAIVAACKLSEKSPDCLFGDKVREATTTARKAAGYYALSAEERATWDTARAAEDKTVVAAQTNAWYKANPGKAGEVGSTCSKTAKCSTKGHCCGTFTSKDGLDALTGRCNPSATSAYTDPLGNSWTHACGAQKVMAAAAAVFATAFIM